MLHQRFTDTDAGQGKPALHIGGATPADPQVGSGKERQVELSFSSETPVLRDFEFGTAWEVLGHADHEVDLSRLNSGSAPLLKDHKRDLDSMVGVVVSARIEGNRGKAVVRFADTPAGDAMLARVRSGEVQNVSPGYAMGNFQEAGELDGYPVIRVTRWEPVEISLVAAPADPTVGVGRSFAVASNINPLKGNTMKPNSNGATVIEERARATEITQLGGKFGMSERSISDAITRGTSTDDFQGQILDHMSSDPAPVTRSRVALPALAADAKPYSLTRAIAAELSGDWRDAGFERELNQELHRITGRAPSGIYVPMMALAGRAVITTATAPSLISTTHMAESFIDVLKPEVQVIALGATVLSGLVENVSIPRMVSGTSAEWIAEDSEASESSPVFDSAALTLKQLSARSRISRRQLKQSLPALDGILMNDLRQQIAIALDRAAITGTGTGDEPRGILNTAGIGTFDIGVDGGAPTWLGVTSLMSQVEAANVSPATLGFLTNYKVKATLMSTPKVPGTDKMILNPELSEPVLAGHRTAFSSNIPDDGVKGTGTGLSSLIFGNWADLLIGQWGGIDLIVDDVTEAGKGNVRIVAHSEWDITVRHPESFSATQDIVTTG